VFALRVCFYKRICVVSYFCWARACFCSVQYTVSEGVLVVCVSRASCFDVHRYIYIVSRCFGFCVCSCVRALVILSFSVCGLAFAYLCYIAIVFACVCVCVHAGVPDVHIYSGF